MAIANEGGFGEDQVAFLTTYWDRDGPAFKRSGAGTRRRSAPRRTGRANAAVGSDEMIGG